MAKSFKKILSSGARAGLALVLFCGLVPTAAADSEAPYLNSLFDPGMGGFAFSKDGDPILSGAEWKVIDAGSDGHQIIYSSRAQVLPNFVSPQHSLIINFRDVGRNPRGIGYVSAVAPGTKFYASLASNGTIEYVMFLHPKIGKVDTVLINPSNCVGLRHALQATSNDEMVLKAGQCQSALDQMLPTRPMAETGGSAQDHPALQEARGWMDQLSQTIFQSPFSRTSNSPWLPGESFGYNFANWARLCSTVPSFAAMAGVKPGLTAAVPSQRVPPSADRAPAKAKETPAATPTPDAEKAKADPGAEKKAEAKEEKKEDGDEPPSDEDSSENAEAVKPVEKAPPAKASVKKPPAGKKKRPTKSD